MRATGRRFSRNGLQLNVVVAGEGDPILLLHGFPDSSDLWRELVPRLTAQGYQAIAPDLRGFGLSDAPDIVAEYQLQRSADDVIAILDELHIEKVKLVGHDWGAVLGWLLAAQYPARFENFVALSVGHPRAYVAAGLEQKLKAWYVLAFQLRGVAEKLITANDWSLFRKLVRHHPETQHWIDDLGRPGRLTAGLNWYRANFWKLVKADVPRVALPVLGIWSTADIALAEDQMLTSAAYVDAPWRYERLDKVSHWIPLDAPDRLAQLLLDFHRR